MTNLCLKVELLAGTNFFDGVIEAKDLAKKLGLAYVMFDFNGVSVYANQHPLEEGQTVLNQKLCDAMESTHKLMII